eukprot:jgi/Mesen1/6288/ME000324S05327
MENRNPRKANRQTVGVTCSTEAMCAPPAENLLEVHRQSMTSSGCLTTPDKTLEVAPLPVLEGQARAQQWLAQGREGEFIGAAWTDRAS